VDLPAALKLVEKLPTPEGRSKTLANMTLRLAASQPEQCETILGRVSETDRRLALLVVCDRMASVDPARARRLADADADPSRRGTYRMALAHGLAKTSREEASTAFREAVDDFDLDQAERPGAGLNVTRLLTLPVVEEIDPTLVPEFLWRALAGRMPKQGTPQVSEDLRYIAATARYDRQLASALVAPIAGRAKAGAEPTNYADVRGLAEALARVDPLAAVEFLEAQPQPTTLDLDGQNEIHCMIADLLGRWTRGTREPMLIRVSGYTELLRNRDLR
jgi:hypothetical protein